MRQTSREMSVLAIIPARGGSKGIPRKNLALLAGKPLISYTIEQARLASGITRVVVSTDDFEIASVADAYHAEVVMRPANISGDKASSEAALLHTLKHLAATEGYQPDFTVFLQCTSPLTKAEDIDGAIQWMRSQKADTCFSASMFHHFLWNLGAGGEAINVNHDSNVRLRRQEKEAQYLETGAIYVMETSGFLEAEHRFFGKTVVYAVPAVRGLEVDELSDLSMAEFLLAKQKKNNDLPEPVQALIMDFDGVFTDNRVLVLQDGQEAVTCDRGDGWGISRLKKHNLPMLVLSKEVNPVVQRRCEKLQIPFRQGIDVKKPVLLKWLAEQKIEPQQAVYLGNDVNDVECLCAVGCGAVVADAHPNAKRVARIILSGFGGHGAIRELTDMIEAQLMSSQLQEVAHVEHS